MHVVAGVDSSTQSCTVELRDASTGQLLATGRRPHPVTYPPVSEQDAESWWAAFVGAFQDACTSSEVRPSDVVAISVAGQGHGLVALDESGQVIRPVKLWNDTTSSPQATRLLRELGTAGWSNAVGSAPTAAFTIAKLVWLAENAPADLARLRTVLVPADWLTFRLCGRRVSDRSNASGTGYYAAHENAWRYDLLRRFVSADKDWQECVPVVLGPAEPAGTVLPDVAALLGLGPDVLVAPGLGDQHAAFLGLGLADGDVLYSLGTSGVVMTSSTEPVHDPSGWVDGVADAAGGYLPLVSTLNCTKVTDTVTRLLGVDHDVFAALALAAPDDPARPVFATFLDGERKPNRPGAQGILAGLTNGLTREQLARATVEGVLLGLVAGHDIIRGCGVDTNGSVVAAGGGSRSPAYLQLLADILQRPVSRLGAPEATARGAAIQAAAVARSTDIAEVRDAWAPPVIDTTQPRPSDAAPLLARYRTLSGWEGLDRADH